VKSGNVQTTTVDTIQVVVAGIVNEDISLEAIAASRSDAYPILYAASN